MILDPHLPLNPHSTFLRLSPAHSMTLPIWVDPPFRIIGSLIQWSDILSYVSLTRPQNNYKQPWQFRTLELTKIITFGYLDKDIHSPSIKCHCVCDVWLRVGHPLLAPTLVIFSFLMKVRTSS